jgi:hypothetical protein
MERDKASAPEHNQRQKLFLKIILDDRYLWGDGGVYKVRGVLRIGAWRRIAVR